MKVKLDKLSLAKSKSDVLCVGIFQDCDMTASFKAADAIFGRNLAEFIQHVNTAARDERFKGKVGQSVSLPTYGQLGARKVILFGLGQHKSFTPDILRKAAANMARRLNGNGVESVNICVLKPVGLSADVREAKDDSRSAKGLSGKAASARKRQQASHDRAVQATISGPLLDGDYIKALVEGWLLGSYTFQKYKSTGDDQPKNKVHTLSINNVEISQPQFDRACQTGLTIAEATNLGRSLIAEPASYMTPARLADEARRVAGRYGLSCKVLDVSQLEKLGMGAFLGVARGAKEPPKFIVMKYEPEKAAKRKIAIVGKGITFDSGGLSLKPAQSMENMKYDMSGAAVVIGTMQVIGALKPAVSVMAVIGATENMPGDGALHPGDVLKSMNGKTIEVNNTDAEGRLVLADALTYALRQGVDELIDVATLTGACVTALGRVAAGIMGSDQRLVDDLIAAGARAGEKLWQLPMFDEYKELLKSDIADLKNAGSRGEAGSASAAMFLREFVDGKPWAHLDIAGPAWLDKDRDECNKGGTAFGVRTLCHYILGVAK